MTRKAQTLKVWLGFAIIFIFAIILLVLWSRGLLGNLDSLTQIQAPTP